MGINYQPQLVNAGFLPSTVVKQYIWELRPSFPTEYFHVDDLLTSYRDYPGFVGFLLVVKHNISITKVWKERQNCWIIWGICYFELYSQIVRFLFVCFWDLLSQNPPAKSFLIKANQICSYISPNISQHFAYINFCCPTFHQETPHMARLPPKLSSFCPQLLRPKRILRSRFFGFRGILVFVEVWSLFEILLWF